MNFWEDLFWWNISIDGTIDAFIYTTWNLNNAQGAETL